VVRVEKEMVKRERGEEREGREEKKLKK